MLSSVTLDDSTGTPVALHADTPTSQAVLVTATGLVGIGPLRSSKRVRPSAHGGIDETRFEEGRGPVLVGEVMSQVNIEDCLAVFRALTRPMLETLDTGPALLKWTEGAGLINLVLNPSSTGGLTGYGTSDSHVAAGAELTAEGTNGPTAVPNAVGRTNVVCPTTINTGITISLKGPFLAGVQYSATVYVLSEIAGGSIGAFMSGSSGSSASVPVTTAGTWVPVALTWTPGTEETSPKIDIRKTVTGTGHFYVSAEIVVVGATVPAYFDGNSSGAEWEGEPGNSVSSSGKNLQMLVRLDSDCEPVLSGGAAHLAYQASFYAEDPRAYSQSLIAAQSGTVSGGEPEPGFITSVASIQAVAVDAGHIYWANKTTNCIGRAALSGATVEPEWIKGCNRPTGVAVNSEHVYWANEGSKAIGRATLAGGTIEQAFISTGEAYTPYSVQVNATTIYFGTSTSAHIVLSKPYSRIQWYIGKATLAGGSVEAGWKELGQKLEPYLTTSSPFAIAIDAGHIYWAETALWGSSGSVGIGRMEIGGGGITLGWVKVEGGTGGVVVDSEHVYWDTPSKAIGRATIAGGTIEPVFIPGATEGEPKGLAINIPNLFVTDAPNGKITRCPKAGAAKTTPLVISQAGNRPTPLVFKIHGLVRGMTIVRGSDGATITSAGEVTAGKYLEIDTADRIVRLDGLTNELGWVSPSLTNWSAFSAPPSPSTESYTLVPGFAENAYLEALYRSAYA